MRSNGKMMLEVVWKIVLLMVCVFSCPNLGKEWERSKDKRESVCIQTAIEFHNVTINFEAHMGRTFKMDPYEDTLSKEGAALKAQMDDIESQLLHFVAAIEAGGGIIPKRENTTTTVDEFSLKMEKEYEGMLRNTKDFTSKILIGYSTVKQDKKRLMAETDEYAKLRQKFLDLNGILIGAGINLQKPAKNALPVSVFDISVLESLLKLYRELDVIEDQITPIWEKYSSFDDMDPSSPEAQLIRSAQMKVEILETIKIAKVIRDNDNMLRHYEKIVNAAVERCLKLLPDLTSMYDEMEVKLFNVANDFSSQDVRIRALTKKYNDLLLKANHQALVEAGIEDVKEVINDDDDNQHDEL